MQETDENVTFILRDKKRREKNLKYLELVSYRSLHSVDRHVVRTTTLERNEIQAIPPQITRGSFGF